MKLLMSLSLLSLLASCSTTTTSTTSATASTDTKKTLSLEEIAEKSQTTSSILGEEKIELNVNNSHRSNGKDASLQSITE